MSPFLLRPVASRLFLPSSPPKPVPKTVLVPFDIVLFASFNPIAPTLLTKSLTKLLSLTHTSSSRRPPKDAIELIVQSSNGDIRSAINALQFLCRVEMSSGKGGGGGAAGKLKGKGSRGGKGGKSQAGKELKAL